MSGRAELIALAELVEAATESDARAGNLDWPIFLAVFGEQDGHAQLRYTTSLDAALMLIPEDWTAWQVRSRRRKTRFVGVLARLIDDIEEEADEEEITAHGRTPALALCAAALRARAATMPDPAP